MISVRKERAPDVAAREALLDQAFGKLRWRKSSQRLRDGRVPAEGLAFVATNDKRIVGTARLWNIVCSTGQPALLLGPVAVDADYRNRGIGSALVRHALAAARRFGHGAVILVGDVPYYSRFGFSAEKTAALRMPGPFERHRLLALELLPGALKGARGLLRAPSQPISQPGLATFAA
jgi:predicted N-acetyltransferase YhbS